nr:hypothetical protein [Tanacetum cinerariifolium]
MRYVDTKPNSVVLRKCILQGPYELSEIVIPGQPIIDDSLVVLPRRVPETFLNISPANKAHYDAKHEAIHLIMTEIGDNIYSTIDTCKTSHDMWISIKRLQQGESLNTQDVKINLFWEFGRFTSRDGGSIESYYFMLYKMMNEMRTLAIAGARETVGNQVVQQTGIQCFNCKEFRNFAKECRKLKHAKDYTYHKEKMLMYMQAEKGVPLGVE